MSSEIEVLETKTQDLVSSEERDLASIEQELFIDIDGGNSSDTVYIFLVDSSYSVTRNFKSGINIFDRMKEEIRNICNDNNVDVFRIIFWNSTNFTAGQFVNGVFIYENEANLGTLGTLFDFAMGIGETKLRRNCITYTWLGFDNVPREWTRGKAKVFLLTDGQMTWSDISYEDRKMCRDNFKRAIVNFTKERPHVGIEIITIEAKELNFTEEGYSKMAGSDVFNHIQDNKLTKKIEKFTSYGRNTDIGFVHFNNLTAPPGHFAFQGRFFHNSNEELFYTYVYKRIQELTNDTCSDFISSLSITISNILEQEGTTTKKERESVLDFIKGMFASSQVDYVMASFILENAVNNYLEGKARTIISMRHEAKEFFKVINRLLTENVRQSIGVRLNSDIISLPIKVNDRVVIVRTKGSLMVEEAIIDGSRYPNSCIATNGYIIPMFKLSDSPSESKTIEQSTRQWVRTMVGPQYNTDKLSDTIFYIFLGLTLQTYWSDNVSDEVKQGYIYTSITMLRKKRARQNKTEIEMLLEGFPPSSNVGNKREFECNMDIVSRILGFNDSNKLLPFTLWYVICYTIDSDLYNSQLGNCQDDIDRDSKKYGFDSIDSLLIYIRGIVSPVHEVEFTNEQTLDYECIITCDSTEETGGFVMNPHRMIAGKNTCSPGFVFSREGLENLVAHSDRIECPICRTRLDRITGFREVGPKPDNVFEVTTKTPGIYNKRERVTITKSRPPVSESKREDTLRTPSKDIGWTMAGKSSRAPPPRKSSRAPTRAPTRVRRDVDPFVIIALHGTIGSGKSLYADIIRKLCEDNGVPFHLIRTDKMRSSRGTLNKHGIKHKLEEFKRTSGSRGVVVIDTCGTDNFNNSNVFDVRMPEYSIRHLHANIYNSGGNRKLVASRYVKKMNMDHIYNYMAWSLRNVLQRGPSDDTTSYYVNPSNTSLYTCVDIVTRKTVLPEFDSNDRNVKRNLIGFDLVDVEDMSEETRERILENIEAKADEYQRCVIDTHEIRDEIRTTLEYFKII